MQLTLNDDLPFITLTVTYQGQTVDIPDVLVDTGSGSTILSADWLAQIGIVPQPDDLLHMIRGVGGTEVVFTRQVEALQLDGQLLAQFQIEVGGMDYGFEINGILGMDALTLAGAILNLRDLTLEFAAQ